MITLDAVLTELELCALDAQFIPFDKDRNYAVLETPKRTYIYTQVEHGMYRLHEINNYMKDRNGSYPGCKK